MRVREACGRSDAGIHAESENVGSEGLKLASLPLMRPVRRSILELVEIVRG